MSSSVEKIRTARMMFFRSNLGLGFFGACAYKFDWVCQKLNPMIEGMVRFKIDSLAEVDNDSILINEDVISVDNYKPIHLVYVLSHETLHILGKHGLRRGDRTPEIWATACEHIVERDLYEIANDVNRQNNLAERFEPHDQNYHFVKELHKKHPKCTLEEAYEWLSKNQNKKIQMKTTNCSSGQNGECNQCPPSQGNDEDGQTQFVQVTDNASGESWMVPMQVAGVDQSKPVSEEMEQKLNTEADQFIADARALYDVMKDQGSMPSSMKEKLKDILKVEIPWERLLEKCIKTNTIMKPDERSWRQLNKFFLPHQITLPGYAFTEDDEGVGTLIICVDTSGSISQKELAKFSSVIVQSMKFFEKIVVMVHDSRTHQIRIFDKDDILGFQAFLENEGYAGRGGTSHEDTFDKIEEKYWNDMVERNELSMVISLTDGYSDLQHIYQKYDWIKNETPLVLLLTSTWSYDFKYDSIQSIYVK